MPYRVIIASDTHESTAGTYVNHSMRGGEYVYDLPTLADAERHRAQFAAMFPYVEYHVVGQWNARDWDAIASRYITSSPAPPVTEQHEDEDERDPCWCGDYDHDEDEHVNHYCDNCEWSCELHECRDCVSYGPEGDWCEGCAESYYDEEGGGEGSPGLRLSECTTCHSYDVHHDDISEVFVCDCQARRLIADKRPVTLAHTLPELEAVA